MTEHARWVRVSRWIVAVSLLTLVFSGIEILMVHPRLYWGEVGNDLTERQIGHKSMFLMVLGRRAF